jgi:Kelch motif/Galactose oxidase, central domain
MRPYSTLRFAFVAALLFFGLVHPGKAGWVLNQPLTTTRYYHTATLLPNGKILVAGGSTAGSFAPLASAELYDPVSGTCTAISPMLEGLSHQTATVLPNGKVLIAGGVAGFSGTADCEIYDPVSNTWTNTGSLNTARFSQTATLLQSGKVLVAGGTAGSTTATAELYDYTTGQWTPIPSMTTARTFHCATLLTNGEVLVTGGQQGVFPVTTLSSAEIYDPVTNVWHAVNSMLSARSSHTATLLPSGSALFAGKVLVTGGTGTTACELYNPATGTWAATANMSAARTYHTASVLPDGNVIVTGGEGANGLVTNTSEIYVTSGGTGSWLKPAVMNTARIYQTATLVPQGRVVVIGGMGTNTTPQATTETLYPGSGSWSLGGGTYEHALGGAATLLPDGKVLVAGGYDSNLNEPTETDLYDPSTGIWTATGNVSGNHLFCSLTLLQNGEVFLTGDFDSTAEGNPSQGELYNPATGIWTDLGVAEPWLYYTATLLLNGKVLFAGGVYFGDRGFTYATNLCYVFDPATQKFTPTGSMNEPRSAHTATLLTSGKVLVAGGADEVSLPTYELISTAMFSPAPRFLIPLRENGRRPGA